MVRRRERWCIMGVNGAGKSTLLKLVAAATTPDQGSVALGANVKMGYFAQHAMDVLEAELTVFQQLEHSFPQAGQGSLRALAGCFGFSGDDIEKKCRVLSGGEKARLVMAIMLFDPPNLLVLDEPTNHLDLDTKEMLIKALSDYEGTMLFVSHDRHFLAALSNRVLELTPDGIHRYDGGYTEYVARTGQEAPGLQLVSEFLFQERVFLRKALGDPVDDLLGDFCLLCRVCLGAKALVLAELRNFQEGFDAAHQALGIV
eukprot:gene34415-46172_t